MTSSVELQKSLSQIEALILKLFQSEPFHNLYLLYNKIPFDNKYGGTCSDKTLSFVSEARSLGFNVALHSGYIRGKEIHRLARVTINEQDYFADIGNGWPSLKLYPANEEINFTCFGMQYRTTINDNWISVFHTRNGKEFLQLEIDSQACREQDILTSIAQRFNGEIIYPFSNSLRFSLVVNNQFLFIRGDRLEIYMDDDFFVFEGVTIDLLPEILKEHFFYDPVHLFKYLNSDT